MGELLSRIHSVADLRALPEEDMPRLAEEIRAFLVEHVEKTGGHLASNLGVVELTLAIHRVFDTPNDAVIWDVGHQSYVHKLLTGRGDAFDTLRQPGGLSGFTKREESPFDPFGAGHSSTAISAGLGFAHANRLAGNGHHAVAIVGDGALTGGLSHEGMNNCSPDLPLVIIINENEMSISRVTGTFPRIMSRIRTSRSYRRIKRKTKTVLRHVPLFGKPLTSAFRWVKGKLRRAFWRANYFEELGISYMGPIDGNDYPRVAFLLREAKEKDKTVVVHLRTKKGKGYLPAEAKPDAYHSVYPNPPQGAPFYMDVGAYLKDAADRDPTVCAITPATGDSTGLCSFAAAHPDRLFDVGIAEGHAVTFAASLAASGMKPYAVIYSSFLQRAYDQILHDVALQGLPVRLLIDRASLATADGPTHHGIYDVSFLGEMPNVVLYAPVTHGSLRQILHDTERTAVPVAIRYPNMAEDPAVREAFYPEGDYAGYGLRTCGDLATANAVIVTYGRLTGEMLAAKALLDAEGVSTALILAERLNADHVADTLARILPESAPVLFAEEGVWAGGFGMQVSDLLHTLRPTLKTGVLAIRNPLSAPTAPTDLYAFHGIDRHATVRLMHDLLGR